MRATTRFSHPRWTLDASHPRRALIRSRKSRRRVRLSFWEASVWLLVTEAGRQREDQPEVLFLSVVPGWRVQPAASSRSYARARDRALKLAQPKGDWEWIQDDTRNLEFLRESPTLNTEARIARVVGRMRRSYRGRLRWYDDDPAPEDRSVLREVAREWSEHGLVARDWQLAGCPGRCPVPETFAAAPELGTWLSAYVEGRPPAPGWYAKMVTVQARLLTR